MKNIALKFSRPEFLEDQFAAQIEDLKEIEKLGLQGDIEAKAQ